MNQNQKSIAGTVSKEMITQESESTNSRQVSWDENISNTSRLTGSSLSRSMTNSKIQSLKKEIEYDMKEIKNSLKRRIKQQEQQMSELTRIIKTMNEDMEQRMAYAVLAAIIKEKEKVQELTHGRSYPASEAPLADKDGNLPYGGKVQLGGPLHRLHHVEVALQPMSTALDAILLHLQKDPTAKYLFKGDDNSETSTIIENQHRAANNTTNQHSNDIEMPLRDFSGAKRQLSENSPTKNRHDPKINQHTSPQCSPPLKKERSDISQPSAEPDNRDRERGRS
jgi:hypothetical protein